MAPGKWRAHCDTIGPLPISAGKQYTARYMEAVFTPGMSARIHRHSGPEAWYLVSGAQCLETPESITIARTGEGAVVPEGPPMALSSVGTETRRSVLLVLHDTTPHNLGSRWRAIGSQRAYVQNESARSVTVAATRNLSSPTPR